MATVSTYLGNKLLDHVLKNTSYTSPSTVYVALYTSDPTIAGSGTEVSGTSYERVSMAFASASGLATSNSADVSFPVAGGSWGTVTHFGIKDALTSGNLLLFGALTSPKTVTTDNQVIFKAGDLDITIS